MQKQLIYVGSTSEHKLRAVREACAELGIEVEIVGIKTDSRVNEQPEGDIEIRMGALGRATDAWWQNYAPHVNHPDISIGIENGIVQSVFGTKPEHDRFVDYAVVVLYNGSEAIEARSAGMMICTSDVMSARWRGFDKHTVASVTSERTGCDATDATPHYTGGRMTRAELLKQAVKLALCQWLAAKENAEDLAILAARKDEQTVPFLEVAP